ncbi:unnamed protein product [Orchesella dallaii]|uniref:Uncharacterized protein n=1 Tax=Orchesella dallaii TaxID=48710 RepID=A0ABP1QIM4_9HEXA
MQYSLLSVILGILSHTKSQQEIFHKDFVEVIEYFAQINNILNQYTLLFHTINPASILPTSILQTHPQTTLSFEFSDIIFENRTNMQRTQKYGTQFSIAFCEIGTSRLLPIVSFFSLAMFPYTLLLLFVNCNFVQNPCNNFNPIDSIRNLPATKVYIYPRLATNASKLQLEMDLNSKFLESKRKSIHEFFDRFALHKNVVEFHKNQFWNGNRQKVSAFVFHPDKSYFDSQNDRYLCRTMALNGRYRDSHFCVYDVMTSIYLSEIHNLTTKLYDLNTERTKVLGSGEEQFMGPTGYSGYPENSYMKQFKTTCFSNFLKEYVIYCSWISHKNIEISSYFAIWVYPFSFKLWLITLSSIMAGLQVFIIRGKKYCPKLLILVILIAGQGLPNGVKKCSKFIFVLVFATFFITNLYGNEITSYIIAPESPKPIQFLSELLSKGYKLVSSNPDVDDKFGVAFKSNGVYNKLNQSFVIDSNLSEEKLFEMIRNKETKYAGTTDIPETDLLLIQSGINWKSEDFDGTDFNCNQLPKPLVSTEASRIVYAVNRHWLFESVMWMHSSGLPKAWEAWRQWNLQRKYKMRIFNQTTGDHGISDQTIQLGKLAPILFIWALFLFAGLLIFGGENRLDKYTNK